ncbi:hypothetical protein DL765_008810 [Monosporascus sp. GIB2]|nr:hypothetical protein DL765_008810 [Monosporascus sp. GIB2]
MKLSLTFVIASLGSAVFAAPAASEANDYVGLTARDDHCYYPSDCRDYWTEEGCKEYCYYLGLDFSHKTCDGCEYGKERCCCVKPHGTEQRRQQ